MKKQEGESEEKDPKENSPRPIQFFDILGRPNFPSFDPGDLLDMEKAPWPDEI